ncbi:MAG: MMPL family transporter [Bdellovibrionaceae bacterium]|jgi:uncharacterized protein|nr:MMPL family transporter [Pseudobdellovibrionaceae bacterium]
MRNSKALEQFLKFIIESPYKSILVGLVFVFLAGFGAKNLYPDFSYRIWFEKDNVKLLEFEAFERRFGNDEVAVIALHSPSGIFDKDSAQVLSELTENLWQAPDVIRVDSLSNFNWVHAEGDEILVEPLIPDDEELNFELLEQRKEIAVNHKSIKGYLINESSSTTLIFASLKPQIEGSPNFEKIITGLREIIAKYEGRSDHTLYLAGTPALNFAFKEASQSDMANLVPIVCAVAILFLILSFRRFSGVVLPLVVIGLTVIATMGFGGWFGFELNNLTSIVPQFMIAISIAVAVHILASFFQFYQQGFEQKEAVTLTLSKNFLPTLLTSISTSVGFFSYAIGSEIPAIAKMGIMAGAGSLSAWVVCYFILGATLNILPLKRKEGVIEENPDLRPSERSIYFSKLIYKWKTQLLVFIVLATGLSIFLASKVTVNSDPFKYFDDQYPLSIATDFMEKEIGSALGLEIVLDTNETDGIKDPAFLKKVDAYQNWILNYKEITKTVSIVDILKEMNKVLNGGTEDQYILPESKELVGQQLFLYTMNLPQGMDINNRVSIKNDSLRLTAMTNSHNSVQVMNMIEEFEQKAKDMGLEAHVTGKFPLYLSNNGLVVKSFSISMSLAVFFISILLIFGLGNVKIGLLSILPNAIPLFIGAAVVYMTGRYLDIGTMIVGSVCLGIAVDDTIHFLANFKKFLDSGDDAKTAVAKVFTHTAPALITTTLVLVAAFATFAFASFIPNQNFGKFVALILSVALILDLTVLPALLLSFPQWFENKKQ